MSGGPLARSRTFPSILKRPDGNGTVTVTLTPTSEHVRLRMTFPTGPGEGIRQQAEALVFMMLHGSMGLNWGRAFISTQMGQRPKLTSPHSLNSNARFGQSDEKHVATMVFAHVR